MRIGIFGLVWLLAEAVPVLAGCFVELGGCFHRAGMLDDPFHRFFAGLDCELGFISCIRSIFW